MPLFNNFMHMLLPNPIDKKLHVGVVLICITSVSVIEDLFICLRTICLSFSWEASIIFFAHFSEDFWSFSQFLGVLYIMGINKSIY